MSDFLDRLNAMPAEKRSYTLAILPTHLAEAGQRDRLRQTLTTFDFLRTKVDVLGVEPLLADYENTDEVDLRLIQGAVRLSAHLLVHDSRPLWTQLYGRLVGNNAPAVQALLAQPADGVWLRPITSSLSLPGGTLVRTLAGHGLSVNSLALTVAGNQVFSASDDGTLRLWNLETGETLLSFPPNASRGSNHPPDLHAITVLSDNQRVVTINREGELQAWNLKGDGKPQTITNYKDTLWALTALPDSDRIVVQGKHNSLDVWDVDQQTLVLTLTGHTNTIQSLVPLPSKQLASASEDKTVRLWDLTTGTLLQILSGHTEGVMDLATSPNGQYIVSASRDTTLRVWDVQTGQSVQKISVSIDAAITAVAVLPDAKRVVSASWDGMLDVWDVTTGRRLNALTRNQNRIHALVALSDGRRVVTGHEDGTLKVWDVEGTLSANSRSGHTDRIMNLEVLPDEKTVVSASADGTLGVWDIETGKQRHRLTWDDDRISDGMVNGMALVNQAKWALLYYTSGAMHLWNLETGAVIGKLKGDGFGFHSATAVPHSSHLLTTSQFGGLNLWDIARGTETTLFRERDLIFRTVISPDGKAAFSMHRQGSPLRAWDLVHAKPLYDVPDLDGDLLDVLVLPDNKRFVVSQSNGSLQLHDLKHGEVLQTLVNPFPPVMMIVAALDNGAQLLTAHEDGAFVLWNLTTGASRQAIPSQDQPLNSVSLLPHTHLLMMLTESGILKLWDIDAGQEIAAFGGDSPIVTCTASTRSMTIIAGEISGQVHFLRLEGIKPSQTEAGKRSLIHLRFWRKPNP